MDGSTQPVSSEPQKPSAADRLDSWKEIAAYLKRSVRTVHRWESEQGLPVRRHLHQSSGTVYAFKSELDSWWASRGPELDSTVESEEKASGGAWVRPRLAVRSVKWLDVALVAIVLISVLAYVGQLPDRLFSGGNPSTIRSVAVLPLKNLTADPRQDYFADGMTDALVTDLAQMSDLRVISRTSQYKEGKKPLSTIARELNVDSIVEGAVLRSGQRVRITAQLIDARTNRHLWARSYERDSNDIVALQAEVAQTITEAVIGKVTSQKRARLAASRPINAEAYEFFFQGLLAASRQSYDGFSDAITDLRHAIAKQPDFAEAYARMSLFYIQFSFVGPLSPQDFMPKAEAAARKALELDETLPEAHAILGIVLYRFHWDWPGAEREFRRALELNPNYAVGHRMFAVFLSASGRSGEGSVEAQRASELDPLSFQVKLELASSFSAMGEYERAIAEGRQVLEMDPSRPRAHFQLGTIYVQKGELKEGIAELEKAVKLSQGNPRFLTDLGYADAVMGKREEAQEILAKLESLSQQQYVSPVGIAMVHLGLAQKETALTWLERGYQIQDDELTGLMTDHRLDPLRSDPRFADLLRRMNLQP